MAKRKALSVRTRFEVFKRDKFCCQYCGRTPPTAVLEVDHIIPVAEDGGNEAGNLLTSCWDCNHGKADVPLTVVPQSLADQIEERKERAAQVAAFNAFLMQERDSLEDIVRELGWHWHNHFHSEAEQNHWVFGSVRVQSIKTFLKRLAPVQIMDAIDITMAKFVSYGGREHAKAWRYFCGVCWGMIKQQDD